MDIICKLFVLRHCCSRNALTSKNVEPSNTTHLFVNLITTMIWFIRYGKCAPHVCVWEIIFSKKLSQIVLWNSAGFNTWMFTNNHMLATSGLDLYWLKWHENPFFYKYVALLSYIHWYIFMDSFYNVKLTELWKWCLAVMHHYVH